MRNQKLGCPPSTVTQQKPLILALGPSAFSLGYILSEAPYSSKTNLWLVRLRFWTFISHFVKKFVNCKELHNHYLSFYQVACLFPQ